MHPVDPQHTRSTPLVLLAFLLLLGACSPAAPAAVEKSFTVRGVVRDVPPAGTTLLIRHDEIPGYMPRMTMELTLLDTNEAAKVHPGDTIEFRLVARADDHFIDRIRLLTPGTTNTPATNPDLASRGTDPGPTPAAARTEPDLHPGDPMPDVPLLSEDGSTFRLSSLRGRAVALTFFFTRCPLPDFCPRMNKHFLEARDRLAADSSAPTNWTLLSLSFDPDIDRPAVLAAHARTYRGTNTHGWRFAVADTNSLAILRPALNLQITREQGGFSHNLRTVVLDPVGRIHRQFDGNRWTPGDLVQAITEATTRTSP